MHALRSCTIPLLAFLAGICLHPHQSAADTDPTDKIHKGVLSANPDGKRDPLGLLCKFDLSYALWTLLGEPIEDYKFKWEACPESRVTWPGGQSLQHIETIHPDAAKSIAEIVPFKVIIRTEVRFYGDVAASKPFAKGILDVEPDLYSPSGKPEQLSVAESPNWDKWFHSFSFLVQEESPHSQKVDGSPGERCSQMCPRAKEVATAACTDVGDDFTQKSCTCEERGPAPYAKIEYACLIKGNPRAAFKTAKKVELSYVDVLYVEWFDVPLEAIAHDVLLKQRRDKELAGKEEDFWRSPTPPTVTTEEAEAVISKSLVRKKDKTVKPRDEAARKQRRARYEELKAQQASQGSSPAGAAQPATASSAGSGEVLIPGGAFAMGNRDGGKVTVGRFYIDITEVTVDAYAACVNAGQCSAPGGRERWQNEGCNWGESGKENHPINCVDWDQASAYCKWKGKRLPTEEEWEWAARGGSRATEFPWGNEEPSTQLCWSGDRRRKGTCAVGSFPGGNSPFGIMDLAGNVQEWTSTIWYDGVNAPDKRVRTIRGGAFANAVSNSVRAEYSHGNAMSNRGKGCGFRCARTAS